MKASIVIPNLNGAGWLRDSIESVWAQTEQDFELIVVDNGSTDESLAIAESYVCLLYTSWKPSTAPLWNFWKTATCTKKSPYKFKSPGTHMSAGAFLPFAPQRSRLAISSRICALNSATVLVPPFSSLRARTETVPSSISLAPTTSI